MDDKGHVAPWKIEESGLVDEQQLARILGVDAGAIRRAVRAGQLDAEKDPVRGNMFYLDSVRKRLAAAGWDGIEPLLTAQQAAGRLRISHGELANLVTEGKLNPVRPLPGMAARYPASEVEDIIEGGRTREMITEAGAVLRLMLSNLVLVVAILIAIFPLIALVRGTTALAGVDQPNSIIDWVGVILAGLALLAGGIFFCYSVRYYVATIIVLASAAPWLLRYRHQRREGRIAVARERDPSHLNLGYDPFVSIQIAAYNEETVIGRLLEACEKLEYPNYEVILVDDSTDGTADVAERWAGHPRFKIIHRPHRSGFKGGALRVAMDAMDSRAEYVVVFDADAVPFPDSIQRLLPHFYEVRDGRAHRKHHVAAVQSYQWHVLNKDQSWLTEAVRAEYSGSYMIERPFQQALGGMKMVAGTAYMIRSDVLRKVGWGTSITEDWELTLHLYTLGYKVAYTPFAETPAECVSGVRKLSRQRMRWAEGHSFNVKKWFGLIFTSPMVSAVEKVEFAFYVTYYLQAVLLLIGTFCWVVAELGFHARIPGWTAVLGWSLVLANLLSLPLMNAAGLVLEEAPIGDFRGALGSIVTAYLLIPYQGLAALRGFFEAAEGTWIRTPKTGRLTGAIHHLRPVEMIQQWAVGLPQRRQPAAAGAIDQAVGVVGRQFVPRVVTVSLALLTLGLTACAIVLPVSAGAPTSAYYLHTGFVMDHTPAGTGHKTTIDLSPGMSLTWTSTDVYPAGDVIPAGTYTFTADWQKDAKARASVTFTVGYGTSCGSFANLVSWTSDVNAPPKPTTTGATTTHATDLPSGGPYHICFRIHVNSITCNGNKCPFAIVFDTSRFQAILNLPAIEVDERSLPLAGVAVMIPLLVMVRPWRRRAGR
ncbi:MAG: glycosyltransferase [Chloroflexi bacterium]|nr:MAG: glycosyltransferase [Chloroflexota bacterium]